MKKFSKNQKLNNVLNVIYNELEDFGIEEIKKYKKDFPNEIDYNIAQWGNLTIYYSDVQEIYKQAGYKTKFTDEQIWNIYKRQVGYLARAIIEEEN